MLKGVRFSSMAWMGIQQLTHDGTDGLKLLESVFFDALGW